MMKAVVLLSGGLDSAANLALARERPSNGEPVLCLTADYGQKAAPREIESARKLCDYYDVRHEVLDLRWLGALGGSALTDTKTADSAIPSFTRDELDERSITEKSAKAVWVPNRNGVLINMAAAYAERLGADWVVVGFNREEAATFADNSWDYLNRANSALELSTRSGVRVHSYTVNWDKCEIVAKLRELAKPFPFNTLWSCYRGDVQPCGKCESCQRLARALKGSA